jgi:hypothetical protein
MRDSKFVQSIFFKVMPADRRVLLSGMSQAFTHQGREPFGGQTETWSHADNVAWLDFFVCLEGAGEIQRPPKLGIPLFAGLSPIVNFAQTLPSSLCT